MKVIIFICLLATGLKISFWKCFQFYFSYISIEFDQDEERASMAFGSADDYYSDMFDYYDDPARAGTIIFRTFEIFNCSYFTPISSCFQWILNFLHRLQ